MNTIDDLEKEVRNSFLRLGPDPDPWVPRIEGVDDAVTIVGAGQSGLAAAFALRRRGIIAKVIDAQEEGREGVWLTRARMATLRTPKDRPGPELGIPALSFRAWYTARFGMDAWDRLGRAKRETWAEYLTWFRKILDIKVSFRTRLLNVEEAGANLRLTVDAGGHISVRTTRKLVLATGLSAGGGPNIPEVISANVPPRLYAHTDDEIDFSRLKGKRIGVLGASASGFDVASAALETGAVSARLFCRSRDLARGTRYRWADFPGADYFHLLPDAERWRIAGLYLARGNHPPPSAIARASAVEGFALHLGSPWEEVTTEGESIHVRTRRERYVFDFVITATGFRHDPRLSPCLQSLAPRVALWKHRYQPPPDERNSVMENYPYLGDSFQYQEIEPNSHSCLQNIHVLNTSALLSFLRIVGDIKCLGFASEKLANGIVRDLFLADRRIHLERLSSPIIEELTGVEYEKLVWRG